MDNLSFTILIFTVVLLAFVLTYSTYFALPNASLCKIERRTILYDWRFWIPCLIYGFLLGFRYDYAYDWEQYYNTFNYIQRGVLYRQSTEVGYLFVNKMLGDLGGNFYSIFILEGVVYIFSLCFLLKDNRKIWLFAIPLVYMINKFNCLNISRQFFAMSILLIAYRLLLDNKKYWFWGVSILASTIHTSCVLFIIPLYFSDKLKPYNIYICILIYFFCVVFQQFFFDTLVNSTSWVHDNILTSKSYDSYSITNERFMRNDLQGKNLIYEIIGDVGYFLCFYYIVISSFFDKIKHKTLYFTTLIGLYAIFFKTLAGQHEIFSRFFYFSNLFTHIGWGVMIYLSLKFFNKVSIFLFLFIVFFVVRTFWVFYVNTTMEFVMGNYIQYKDFAL